jgi:hypothetical protein
MGDMRVELRRQTMTLGVEAGPRRSSGCSSPAAQRGDPAMREDLMTRCHLIALDPEGHWRWAASHNYDWPAS